MLSLGFIPPAAAEAVVWALLHSLWIAGLIYAVSFGLIKALPYRFSNQRYWIATGSFFLITAITVLHPFLLMNNSIQEPAEGVIVLTPKPELAVAESGSVWKAFYMFIQAHSFMLLMLWCSGVFLFLLRFLAGIYEVRQLKRLDVFSSANAGLEERLQMISIALGIRQKVQLLESLRVKTPVLIGYLKPVILFPFGMLQGMPVSEVEAIIAHELAHLRRHDYLINMAQAVIEVVFFFNHLFGCYRHSSVKSGSSAVMM